MDTCLFYGDLGRFSLDTMFNWIPFYCKMITNNFNIGSFKPLLHASYESRIGIRATESKTSTFASN